MLHGKAVFRIAGITPVVVALTLAPWSQASTPSAVPSVLPVKAGGKKGYQTRINVVLESYVRAQQKSRARRHETA